MGHNTREDIRIFGYLKKFHKAKIVIDPTLPDHHQFPCDDLSTWRDLYPDALEERFADAPTPKGSCMHITIWVDADHARDKVTCRSVTGVVVMLNNVIVNRY